MGGARDVGARLGDGLPSGPGDSPGWGGIEASPRRSGGNPSPWRIRRQLGFGAPDCVGRAPPLSQRSILAHDVLKNSNQFPDVNLIDLKITSMTADRISHALASGVWCVVFSAVRIQNNTIFLAVIVVDAGHDVRTYSMEGRPSFDRCQINE